LGGATPALSRVSVMLLARLSFSDSEAPLLSFCVGTLCLWLLKNDMFRPGVFMLVLCVARPLIHSPPRGVCYAPLCAGFCPGRPPFIKRALKKK